MSFHVLNQLGELIGAFIRRDGESVVLEEFDDVAEVLCRCSACATCFTGDLLELLKEAGDGLVQERIH